MVNIIHIGKTGGSAITESIKGLIGKETKYGKLHLSGHSGKLTNEGQHIFFVRNPIDRFVSAYFSGYREGKPKYFYGHTPEERKYFKMFPTPNHLAEALSEDGEAKEAMKHLRHVRDPLSKYLGDVDNIESCLSNILFVGTTENLTEDFVKINKLLETNTTLVTGEITIHKTPKEFNNRKKLSNKGINNLINYYNEDYDIINKLHELGLIEDNKHNQLCSYL